MTDLECGLVQMCLVIVILSAVGSFQLLLRMRSGLCGDLHDDERWDLKYFVVPGE